MIVPVTKATLPPLDEYIEYLKRIWSTSWLTNDGDLVRLLEEELRQYLGIDKISLLSNGTLALQIALKALHIRGEVITTPFTFAATTNALLWEGLTPVFADIDSETYNIDPADVERKITNKTRAILAVHVYGNPCYVHELQKIADKHNLKIIYDAAHAFGVKYENTPITDFGDVSILSFHATKVFNTIEGGAIIARDQKIVEEVNLLRNHGIKSVEQIAIPGTNAKMNEFQAAMGLCNLKRIDSNIYRRKMLYEAYVKELSDDRNYGFQKLISSAYNYSYMPVLLDSKKTRDTLFSELVRNGVTPRKYFFPLVTDFDYFKSLHVNLTRKYNLVNSVDIANRILCLPLFPDLKQSDLKKIVRIARETSELETETYSLPTVLS